MAKLTRKLMQPAYFNQGQPEGYTRTQCIACNATGTKGGSKCPTCAGYGAYYHKQEEGSGA